MVLQQGNPLLLTKEQNTDDHSNAKEMYRHLTVAPYLSGVVITATVNWKKNQMSSSSPFFGGSYAVLTSAKHIMQQLGLSVNKGYGSGRLIQQASKHMGVNLPSRELLKIHDKSNLARHSLNDVAQSF